VAATNEYQFSITIFCTMEHPPKANWHARTVCFMILCNLARRPVGCWWLLSLWSCNLLIILSVWTLYFPSY